jgi:hypothetical protein
VSALIDLGDVADLRHVEQRGHARQPRSCRRRWPGTACGCSSGDGQHLRGDVLGQAVAEGCGRVGVQHLGHAGDLRAAFAAARRVVPGDQHVHVAAAGFSAAVTVLSVAPLRPIDALSCSAMTSAPCQITFASFLSLSTSVATSAP